MPPRRGQTTERTYYPLILDIIRDRGGVGVQEVTYNSEPDIVFTYLDRPWFMSVKIGGNPATQKDAFLQYLRHKDDSRIAQGLLLFLPEVFREIPPEASALREALDSRNVIVLVDTASVKEQVGDRPLPSVLDLIRTELTPLIARGERRDYPLTLVVSLMRAQVTQIMADLAWTRRTSSGSSRTGSSSRTSATSRRGGSTKWANSSPPTSH